MKKALLRNSYCCYTFLFLILLPVIFYPFLKEGRTLVWYVDGISQHYPCLIYYGRILRKLISGGGFAMVDFQIGMGFDTITTLHYYVLGDPLALFSVFMTPENGTIIYNMLILLRFYLAGISFLYYCGYYRYCGYERVLGALIYTFCGYSFFSGVRHPFFLNPMIYLPLLLIGLEQVLRKRKPYLLIGMVFLCTISNFYFLYLLTVISVIYVVFRYLFRYRRDNHNPVSGFFRMGLRTGGFYLLGTALAAVIFLPVVYAFLQNGRNESKPQLLVNYFHYNKGYYLDLLQGMLASGVSAGYWAELAFPAVTAVSLSVLVCNKKYRTFRRAFFLSFLALCIPAFGYFMNAFSYITNRWDFLFAFIIALVFTVTCKDLFKLKRENRLLLGLGTGGYAVLAFFFQGELIVKVSFFILFVTVLIVLLLQTKQLKKDRLLQWTMLTLLVVSGVGFNGFAFYSARYHGYAQEFLTKQEVEEKSNGAEASIIKEIEDKDFYRIETYGDKMRNEALVTGFHDVSGYFSLMDGKVTSYLKQLELCSQRAAYRYDNFDNRTALDVLAGVKYLVTTSKTAVPYAFRLIREKNEGDKSIYLYENTYALPIGYTYHDYMLEEDYNQLEVLEKQNALLYCAVLEKDNEYGERSEQDMSTGIARLNLSMDVGEGIVLEDGLLRVQTQGAWLTLRFEAEGKSELYIRFPELSIAKEEITMQTIKVKGEKEAAKPVNIRSRYHNTYFGKTDYLVNTGYSKAAKKWVRITFPQKTVLRCGEIEVFCVGMEHYKQQIRKLGQEILQKTVIKNNRIEGEATLNSEGIMMLGIPYSKGWSAYVDGRKTKLLRANVMYTAVELAEGTQHIILKYETPYLRQGILLSAAALLVLSGIIIYYHYNTAKERQEKDG